MTRKHYVIIAEAIAEFLRVEINIGKRMDRQQGDDLIRTMSAELKHDNPNFDSERFAGHVWKIVEGAK